MNNCVLCAKIVQCKFKKKIKLFVIEIDHTSDHYIHKTEEKINSKLVLVATKNITINNNK